MIIHVRHFVCPLCSYQKALGKDETEPAQCPVCNHPDLPRDWVKPFEPSPTFVAPKPNPRCSKCNLELAPVMGYSCTQSGCPVFPQVSC